MAIDLQVPRWADRPSATIRGRYMWVEDDKNLWRSTGTGWELITRIGSGGAGRPVVVAGTAVEGSSQYAARADHTHTLPLATTGAHGAMSSGDKSKLDSATANAASSRLAQRDGNGNIQFAQVAATATVPTASNHLARKDYVDTRDAITLVQAGANTDTAIIAASSVDANGGQLARRNAAGQTSVSTPTASTHAVNKGYVDGATGVLNTWVGELDDRVHAAETDLSQATYQSTGSRLVRRTAAGYANFAGLSVTQPITQMTTTDVVNVNYVRNQVDPLTYKSGVRYYDHTTGNITGRVIASRVGYVVTVTFDNFGGTLIGSGTYNAWATIGPALPVGIRPQSNSAVNPTNGPSFRVASNGIPYVRTPGTYSGTTATLTYVVETEPPASFTWGIAS